jgi:hypothetical protein
MSTSAYPNAFESLALEDLPLREVLPKKVHRRLLSKLLITSTTQFNAANAEKNDAAAAAAANSNTAQVGGVGGTVGASSMKASSSYIVKKKIKSPQALLQDVDAQTTKGITVADALASLFPPAPWTPPQPKHGDDVGEGAVVHVDPTVRGELSDSEEDVDDVALTTVASDMHVVKEEAMVAVARADHAEVLDVVCLQERVLQLCAEGKAKLQGVCSLREAVYDKAMQELIRQVTVLCPERGLLLAELTEEIKESTGTYDLLFDSACQYAVRKAIERDLYRTMLRELDELRVQSRTIENRVQELRAKREGLEKRFAEQRETERKQHEDEVAFLKRGNAQLSAEIKRLTL